MGGGGQRAATMSSGPTLDSHPLNCIPPSPSTPPPPIELTSTRSSARKKRDPGHRLYYTVTCQPLWTPPPPSLRAPSPQVVRSPNRRVSLCCIGVTIEIAFRWLEWGLLCVFAGLQNVYHCTIHNGGMAA